MGTLPRHGNRITENLLLATVIAIGFGHAIGCTSGTSSHSPQEGAQGGAAASAEGGRTATSQGGSNSRGGGGMGSGGTGAGGMAPSTSMGGMVASGGRDATPPGAAGKDGGSGADRGPDVAATNPRPDSGPLTCGSGEWPSYGHDTRNTFASDGCMTGPLAFAWGYLPKGLDGSNRIQVHHAVTSAGMVYVRFSSSKAPQMDGVSTAGDLKWTWASSGGRDVLFQYWATFANGALLVADDGLMLVDADAGTTKKTINKYDDWGHSKADDQRFYINSDLNSPDGPGFYVGAYTLDGTAVWKKDQHKSCDRISEKRGSIVVDRNTVFRSGVFVAGAPAPSGIATYDKMTGAPGWKQPTTPLSAISAGDGQLYLVEDNGGEHLVARKQDDGMVVWSQPLTGNPVSTQAPVLANGLVIVATKTDVRAFRAQDGAVAWTAANINAAVGPSVEGSGTFNNCPGNPVPWSVITNTTLAAALGSHSLVATATDGIHVLSLTDGKERWKGLPESVKGPLRNPVIVGHTLYAAETGAGGRLVALTSP